MTNQEAINHLNMLINEVYNEDSDGYEYAKAIDMAIEALSTQEENPCDSCQEFDCYGCEYKR